MSDALVRTFRLLFRSGDQICVGDQFATEVGPQPIKASAPFYSLNPLHPSLDHVKAADGAITAFKSTGRRADLNVTRFHNFLFEMDNTPLDVQLQHLQSCGIPWATIVYSGGKSYHAILSLEQPLEAKPHTTEGIDAYKQTWKTLAAVITQRLNQPLTLLDSACQNPSRLTRTPGAVRDNGNVQELIQLGRLCSADELAQLLREGPAQKQRPKIQRSEHEARSEEDLKLLLPVALVHKLKFPKTWASGTGAGNYQSLLKIVLWAIDSTGVDKETLTNYMERYTFPYLLKTGYPAEKIYKAINDGFNMKGIL